MAQGHLNGAAEEEVTGELKGAARRRRPSFMSFQKNI